ncbi:MAG: LacI family DNA-binding transcriptional regulator [Alphaproteobacteria bacterium]|nr:MAG: LacI family DNA-binding transcriptional regulator [Alphaproteobacteria bacterium]
MPAKAGAVTMQQVAECAGVSMMTVSRVLNDDARVRESTRIKVMRAVAALGYRPNISARSLAGARSYLLGLLYANPSAAYISELLIGALKSCRAAGYHLVVESCDMEEAAIGEQMLALAKESRLDGLILPPPLCESAPLMAALEAARIPYVRIAPFTRLDAAPYVCIDDAAAARDITARLIALGHRRIGFIKGHPNQGASRLRLQGFQDAMQAAGLRSARRDICQGYFSYKSGLRCAEKLLNRADRPTAIFASNDDMAAAVYAVAHRHGLDIPQDLSVVGFDDTLIATTLWPPLTTVRQPIAAIAGAAVELLTTNRRAAAVLRQPAAPRRLLDYAIVERQSTAPPTTPD